MKYPETGNQILSYRLDGFSKTEKIYISFKFFSSH